MSMLRKPAVAGVFYPADATELATMVRTMLAHAKADYPIPKAIIAPHAGYIYSGPIAANAYACLGQAATRIKTVVVLGPAHRYLFHGLALPESTIFLTPLGQIKIASNVAAKITSLPQIKILEAAHLAEHSLEVQLPFLQTLLKDFTLLPLVVGQTNPTEIAEVLDMVWGGPETLLIISSDLSHYYNYQTTKKLDQETSQAIMQLQPELLLEESACGKLGIQGLLQVAKKRGLKASLIDLRNSGDTAGPHKQVVGYGAFHFG